MRGDQLVSDLCRPGRNAVQTVVAHGQELLFKSTPATQEDAIKKSVGGRMLSSHGAYPPSEIRSSASAPNQMRLHNSPAPRTSSAPVSADVRHSLLSVGFSWGGFLAIGPAAPPASVIFSDHKEESQTRGKAFAPAIWPVAATTPRCHIPAMQCCSGELAHGRIHQSPCRVF